MVVTVGKKIGKSHLTYAKAPRAEMVAAGTIAAADIYGHRFRPRTSCRRAWPAHGGQRFGPAIGDGAQSADGQGL
jgi:hypothetical protein